MKKKIKMATIHPRMVIHDCLVLVKDAALSLASMASLCHADFVKNK